MELLRKLKKLTSGHAEKEDHPPPLPRGRHRRRQEAASPMMDYGRLPRSFFNAVNSARENAGYDALPVFPGGPDPNGDEPHLYEDPDINVRAFDRSRPKSRDRAFDRSARRHSRSTPVKFRRRPVSPELLRARTASPFHFRQHSLPTSQDMHHHFQHLPRHHQFDMRMAHPAQFYPQFQQPFYPPMYPHVHMQPWLIMRQPQIEEKSRDFALTYSYHGLNFDHEGHYTQSIIEYERAPLIHRQILPEGQSNLDEAAEHTEIDLINQAYREFPAE